MPTDLALNFSNEGDLVFAANRDLQVVTGPDLIKQRIMVRLFIQKPWDYDPTGGTLGSRLYDVTHYQRRRALSYVELIVREALEPMNEIRVTDVVIKETDDERRIEIYIQYVIIDDLSIASEAIEQDLVVQLFV
jgi:hypothetical protein